MSFQYPPLRPEPSGTAVLQTKSGPYGVPDRMLTGFPQAKAAISENHPLEFSEKHWAENQMKLDFAVLRNTQGIYAPLHLKCELDVASRIQRLPGLPSSNLMSDVLTGRLDSIAFEDILNDRMDAELMDQPHILMERHLGLL